MTKARFEKKAYLTPELITAALGALIAPAIGYAVMPKRKETDPLLPRILALLGLGALGGGVGYLGGRYVPRLFTKAEPAPAAAAPAEPAPAAAAPAAAAAAEVAQTFDEAVESDPRLRAYVRALSDEEQEELRRLYNTRLSDVIPILLARGDQPIRRELQKAVELAASPFEQLGTAVRAALTKPKKTPLDYDAVMGRALVTGMTGDPDTAAVAAALDKAFVNMTDRLGQAIEAGAAPFGRAATGLKRYVDELSASPLELLEKFERYRRGGIEGR